MMSNFVRKLSFCVGAAVWVVASQVALAVGLGQMDDFEDTTTQGWRVGAPGGGAQPINVSTGGPNGAGDAYLQYSSAGGGGPLSRLVFFNDSQWTGDFIGEGITQITADVNNLGSTELELRLAFGTGVSGNSGSWFVSTDSITLPTGSGWQAVSFSLAEADLTSVLGTGTYNDVLSGVGALRILSSSAPDNKGDVITGTVGVDNITAVPEPASALLLGLGLIASLRRRKP